MNPLVARRLPPGTDPDAGKPPRLEWLPISSLVIDPAYQREVNITGEKNIVRIAEKFSWSKFSPVIVAQAGDKYTVIDGQHRSTAALSLGYDRVPCAIVQARPEDAAGIFAAINGDVTPMATLAVFKAARAAGMGWAMAVDRACKAAGVIPLTHPLQLSKQKPLMTMAIGSMRQIHLRHGEDVLRVTLQCLAAAKDSATLGFISGVRVKQWGGIMNERRGWVADPRMVIAVFANAELHRTETTTLVSAIQKVAGDGRQGGSQWLDVKQQVAAELRHKLPHSAIAGKLRLSYADVNRAVAEIKAEGGV